MDSFVIPAHRVMIGDRVNNRMVEGIWTDGVRVVLEFANYETISYKYDADVRVSR